MSVSKRRSISQLAVQLPHHAKRHCPEDLACGKNGPSVEVLLSQVNVLKQKVAQLQSGKLELERSSVKMARELKNWERKAEELGDNEAFRKQVREMMRAELEREKRAEDLMMLEKVEYLTKLRAEMETAKNDRQQQLFQRETQMRELKQEIAKKDSKIDHLEKELVSERLYKEQAQKKGKEMGEELEKVKAYFKEKSDTIQRLQAVLTHCQKQMLVSQTRASEQAYQTEQSREQLKNKENEVKALQEQNNRQEGSIAELNGERGRLNKLVGELDATCVSYAGLEEQLRRRLQISEQDLVEREICFKQLEADYYDCLRRTADP